MMSSINLLPWRMEQHRQRLKRFIGNLLIWGILLFLGFNGLFDFIQHQQIQEQALQHSLNQQKQQLRQLQQQNQKLQQQNLEFSQQLSLSPKQIQGILQLLSSLPFQQGELSQSQVLVQQDKFILSLEGHATEQQEFERLYQFLNQQTSLIEQVKLNQFTPLANGNLQFLFDLELKNEK